MAGSADYYEQLRADPMAWEAEWGDPEPAPSKPLRQSFGAVVSVRFSPVEAETIRQLAVMYGKTITEIVHLSVAQLAVTSGLVVSDVMVASESLDVGVIAD